MPEAAAHPAPAVSPAGAFAHPPSVVIFIATLIVGLVADLAVKHIAFERVAHEPVVITPDIQQFPEEAFPRRYPHDAITVVPKILALKLVTNGGAVFGMGQGQRGFFILVSAVAVGVIGFIFWRSRPGSYWQHVALGLVLAGALGNLYDRMVFGVVRDMLVLFPGVKLPFGLHWPGTRGSDELYPWVFNIADAALLVGVAMLIIWMWRSERRQRTVSKAQG